MEIGDIVTYDHPGYALRSGCEEYADAVVVQTTPNVVLVSRETDMRWESTVHADKLKIVGKADDELLERCKSRL